MGMCDSFIRIIFIVEVTLGEFGGSNAEGRKLTSYTGASNVYRHINQWFTDSNAGLKHYKTTKD
jgi:hypothetical protein